MGSDLICGGRLIQSLKRCMYDAGMEGWMDACIACVALLLQVRWTDNTFACLSFLLAFFLSSFHFSTLDRCGTSTHFPILFPIFEQ